MVEFVKEYGGLVEWEAAETRIDRVSDKVDKRMDEVSKHIDGQLSQIMSMLEAIRYRP